jgi:hypothetical protein
LGKVRGNSLVLLVTNNIIHITVMGQSGPDEDVTLYSGEGSPLPRHEEWYEPRIICLSKKLRGASVNTTDV